MMEPLVSYLNSRVPTAACEMAIVFRSAGSAYFACRVQSLRLPSPLLRCFLRITTAIARKKITVDELIACGKANGYQRGTYQDENGLRDRNKHMDKIKQD
jgi:hypothetical protein